jgi:hypothetical protein
MDMIHNRYIKDALDRLPTQPASRLEELLPHQWQALDGLR